MSTKTKTTDNRCIVCGKDHGNLPCPASDIPITTHDEQMTQIRTEGLARLKRQREGAKYMRDLANEIRSPDIRMVSTDGAIARLAEGIATILESMT